MCMKKNIWVSDLIKEKDIQQWKQGDIIAIKAGTGQGKSYFIKNTLYEYAKANNKKILLLVHRINCEEQFKMNTKGKESTIKIEKYQTIDYIYENDGIYNFSMYDYIVCDEFHYFTSDASFNNTTDMSIKAILEQINSIRIFMSATADLMEKYINKYKKLKTIDYKLDSDFSFINKLYFYTNLKTEEKLIENIIKKNERCIVFINDRERLEKLYLKYKDHSLFNCAKGEKEYKHVKPDTITKMLKEYKFNENIIFTTSVMDTGISIKDERLKHIICSNITDINVLIQMLGRKRILHDEDKVNVYIKNINNNVLGGYLRQAKEKARRAKYLKTFGQNEYIKKYKKKPENKSIIYFNVEDGDIIIRKNEMAYFKTLEDIVSFQTMIDRGYKKVVADTLETKYANIEHLEQKQTLEEYLEGIVGKRLYKEEQQELSDLIIKELVTISKNVSYKTKKLKHTTLENIIRVQLNLPFAISESKREDRFIDGKRIAKRYIIISKIM